MSKKYIYAIKQLDRTKSEAVKAYEHVVKTTSGSPNKEIDTTLLIIKGRIKELSNAIKLLTYC